MDNKQVTEIKRIEKDLAAARETARTGFLASVADTLTQLQAIGFNYELVEVGGPKKIGRPKKGGEDGVPVG